MIRYDEAYLVCISPLCSFHHHTVKMKLSLGLLRHYTMNIYERRKIQINEFLMFVLEVNFMHRPLHPAENPTGTQCVWVREISLPPIVNGIIPLLSSTSTKTNTQTWRFRILRSCYYRVSNVPLNTLLSSTPKILYVLNFTTLQNRQITKVPKKTYLF